MWLCQASSGVYEDKSGPEMARLVLAMPDSLLEKSDWPCGVAIAATGIVPDDTGQCMMIGCPRRYVKSFT